MRDQKNLHVSTTAARNEEFVSVSAARALVGRRGKPVARQTIFVLAACQRLDVRAIAGRYLVSIASIREYKRLEQSQRQDHSSMTAASA